MCGNHVAVGAFQLSPRSFAGFLWGAVYVYTRAGAEWQFEAELNGDGSADGFGKSVSLTTTSGATFLAVSAPDGDPTTSHSGAVYVFSRSSIGAWSVMKKMLNPQPYLYSYFGWHIDLQATTLAVGAPDFAGRGGRGGEAYLFHFDPAGNTWALNQTLTALDWDGSDLTADASFGWSVSLSTDESVLMVGSVRANQVIDFHPFLDFPRLQLVFVWIDLAVLLTRPNPI